MCNYRKHGKVQTLLSPKEFKDAMNTGHFCKFSHRAFCILLYYTGVRRAEALRAVKEQFQVKDGFLRFDVKRRLKGGTHTPPLKIPTAAAFVSDLIKQIDRTKKGKKVFTFHEKTAWNIVDRIPAFHYPHYFRLNRTSRILEKFSILKARSWTGHKSLKSLDSYAGVVDVEEIGESLD